MLKLLKANYEIPSSEILHLLNQLTLTDDTETDLPEEFSQYNKHLDVFIMCLKGVGCDTSMFLEFVENEFGSSVSEFYKLNKGGDNLIENLERTKEGNVKRDDQTEY